MGAYFRTYIKGNVIKKTLIRKKNGSPYPDIDDFNEKISLIKKYLGDFVADTKVEYDGKSIRMEQQFIEGEDIFVFLKAKTPRKFTEFVQKINTFYLETGILLDLVNGRNILVTKDHEIKIVDVWPLFFRERVASGDLNEESYNENLQRFISLKTQASL